MIKLRHTRTGVSREAHDIIHNMLVESEKIAEKHNEDPVDFARGLVNSTRIKAFGVEQYRSHQSAAAADGLLLPLNESSAAFFNKIRTEVASFYFDSNTFVLAVTEMLTLLPAFLSARDQQCEQQADSHDSHEHHVALLQAFYTVCTEAYVDAEPEIFHRVKLYVRTLRALDKMLDKVGEQQQRVPTQHNVAMQKLIELVQTLVINRMVSLVVRTLSPVAIIGFLFVQRKYMKRFLPEVLQNAFDQMLDTERTPEYMLCPPDFPRVTPTRPTVCVGTQDALLLFGLVRSV